MTLFTEDEAKDKWCPFARLSEMGTYNRCGPAANLQCIGSACMAWRWIPSSDGESKIEGIKRRREETGAMLVEAKNFVDAHPEYLRQPSSDRGFCGLAGRPS